MSSKILFIGATGMLGKPVARQLIRAGYQITLLGRDEQKTKAIFPDTSFAPGDIFQKETLIKAMQGHDAVYMNLSVLPQSREKDPQAEREGIENIIAAAKETGIRRLANISSLVHRYNGMNGFCWWAFDVKKAAVDKVKASGIPYTIFYPSTFMETYPYQVLRGNKIGVLGKSEMPMWMISADDYGNQVAASFALPGNDNREYAIQGPEAMTFGQANEIFIKNYKKAQLKTMKAPIGVLKLLGVFNQRMNYIWHICEALNKYPEKFESEKTWQDLGKPATTLAAYAASL